MGAWIALRARREGWRTTLIDAFGAGHARATSGDETRIIRASHSDDPFYSRWSREALTGWNALAESIGEALFVPAGVLWLAHDEGGWEAASEATLRAEGIPVERLSPDDIAARWPQMRSDDLAFAIFEPEAGLLMARRGVAAVARTFDERGWRVRPRLGGAGRGGRAPAARCRPGRRPAPRRRRVRVRRRPVAAAPLPGRRRRPRPGDEAGRAVHGIARRATAVSAPEHSRAGSTTTARSTASRRSTAAGMKVGPDRYGPIFDPTDGERIVDPESVEIVRVLPGDALPGPGRRAGRRDARLPVRDDAGQPVHHRPPSRLRQRLARRRRLRPRLQARTGHRPLRGRPDRRRGRPAPARSASASIAHEPEATTRRTGSFATGQGST